jgi:hypothetical protein
VSLLQTILLCLAAYTIGGALLMMWLGARWRRHREAIGTVDDD